MKISPINYNTQIYNNNFRENTPRKNTTYTTASNNADDISFTGRYGLTYFANKLGLNPFSKLENFSIEEYNNLSSSTISRLRKQYKLLSYDDPYFYDSIADIHSYAAGAMQTVFDSRFGKGNYVVVPIGRSLSSFCKVLGYKIGENNVVNIPMSDAKRFSFSPVAYKYAENIENIKSWENIKRLTEYLEKNNLSRKTIETSGKNYILTDYCVSGLSLEGAEWLFKSDLVWGNKKRNIFTVDFLKLLNSVTFNQEAFDTLKSCHINKVIDNMLFESEYKKFAFVGQADYLYSIPKSSPQKIMSNASKSTKLVWFHLLDNEMTNRGVDKFNIKMKEAKPIIEIPEQKVEPWHDGGTQYEYDLRDDLNEINKLIMRFSNINTEKLSDSAQKQYSKNKLHLYTLYNRLSDFYKQQANMRSIIKYYLNRQNIFDKLTQINEYISQYNL